MSGWASNSKYAFLGALRSAAQLISYEVSMGLVIMGVLVFSSTTNLSSIVLSQTEVLFFFPLFPSFLLFLVSILAETCRVPFDLPEAESELVSGYNVEYSSVVSFFFFWLNILILYLCQLLVYVCFLEVDCLYLIFFIEFLVFFGFSLNYFFLYFFLFE